MKSSALRYANKMLPMFGEKAGMQGVDKEKISKIIDENTGQKFSAFSKKKQDRIDKRNAEIKRTLESLGEKDLQRLEKEVDKQVAALEKTRDLTRHCVHIDMDAFFAAVEMRDEPRLRTIPMGVGSYQMLSTSNYIARRFGVRAAMPGFIAKKLCPELEIIAGNYRKYGTESRIFSKIFDEYDPDTSMGSLDEAYLDITEYVNDREQPKTYARIRYSGECSCRLPYIDVEELKKESNPNKQSPSKNQGADDTLQKIIHSKMLCSKCSKERWIIQDQISFGTTRGDIVREIRFRVEQATGLTCSAGIAANFMLAKISSDFNKPNGQYELENDREKIIDFLKELPIRKVSGIGGVSEAHLKAAGISTVGDIWARRVVLPTIFSAISTESFLRTSMGLPHRPSTSDDHRRKSISVETTFQPTGDEKKLREKLRGLSEELAGQLPKAHICGGFNVGIKIKLATFDVLTRANTTDKLASKGDEIYKIAETLLERELGVDIRLLGVRLSKLEFVENEVKEDEKKKGSRIVDYMKSPKKQSTSKDVDTICMSSGDEIGDSDGENVAARCPLCGQELPIDDERAVNAHLDECLNADLLKTLENGRLSNSAKETKNIAKGGKSKSKAPNTKKVTKRKSDTQSITTDQIAGEMELKFAVKQAYRPTPPKRPLHDDDKENRVKSSDIGKNTARIPFKRFVIDDGEFRTGHPLRNVCIAIDVENKKASSSLQADIQKLGGQVVYSINDEPSPVLLVSDHSLAEKLETLPDPLKQLNEAKLRSLPPIFRNAWKLSIRVRSKSSFEKILDSIKSRTRVAVKKKFGDGGEQQDAKAGPIKRPFVKIDFDPEPEPSTSQQSQKKFKAMHYQPAFEEFEKDDFPTIYLGEYTGESLFEKMQPIPEQLIKPSIEPDLSQKFEELNDSACSKAFLTDGSEKEVHCELCNVKVSPTKKEQHYSSATHLTKTLAPATYSAFDEFLGVREDYAGLIKLPPSIPQRIWPTTKKNENLWKEANDFDGWLQKMAGNSSTEEDDEHGYLDDLRIFLNSQQQELFPMSDSAQMQGDSFLEKSYSMSDCEIQADDEMFVDQFSAQSISTEKKAFEEKELKIPLSSDDAKLQPAIDQVIKKTWRQIQETSKNEPDCAQFIKTLCFVDDMMQNVSELVENTSPRETDACINMLAKQGVRSTLNEFTMLAHNHVPSLVDAMNSKEFDKKIQIDRQPVENKFGEQLRKTMAEQDHPARTQPDFDIYKAFFI
ncbi:unnamed protein product, partial [Mesorhabditis belari]|uniref:DNA polymerase kappa n=1 Tax=Mesorhabditis belari TaxID=2138241 RepID=A0AAF3JAX9_9BILA